MYFEYPGLCSVLFFLGFLVSVLAVTVICVAAKIARNLL